MLSELPRFCVCMAKRAIPALLGLDGVGRYCTSVTAAGCQSGEIQNTFSDISRAEMHEVYNRAEIVLGCVLALRYVRIVTESTHGGINPVLQIAIQRDV